MSDKLNHVQALIDTIEKDAVALFKADQQVVVSDSAALRAVIQKGLVTLGYLQPDKANKRHFKLTKPKTA